MYSKGTQTFEYKENICKKRLNNKHYNLDR